MTRKTHRTEIHIETHEIKIIRFGTKRVDAKSDDIETPPTLLTEHAAAHKLKEGEDHEKGNQEN